MRSRFTLQRGVAMLVVLVAALGLTLVATGCGAEEEARKVEQALHDDIVTAYNETKDFLASEEQKVDAGTEQAWAKAKADFAAIEAKLEEAEDFAGKEAIRAYREIQHDLRALHHEAETVLHVAAHDIESAAESVWHGLKAGYQEVHDRIDHAVDDLHF